MDDRVSIVESALEPRARRPAYRKIADEIRAQIVEGRFSSGAQLPSTEELARTWQSSYFTVHTALQLLAKEGWIERLNGSGTYVSEHEKRFTTAGIYHGADIFSNRRADFGRRVHAALTKQLGDDEKGTLTFIDSRSEAEQKHLLPSLEEAIRHRHIQCLLVPTGHSLDLPELSHIRLPTAFISNIHSNNRVDFDFTEFIEESISRLAAQGCRSFGLISSVPHQEGSKYAIEGMFTYFRQSMQRKGFFTRDEWIRKPAHYTADFEYFGYRELQALWGSGERPQAILVYPDTVVQGVITAALELRINVPEQVKFAFHRNGDSSLLCPFPAIWAISDENLLAAAMIDLIKRQFRGETISPGLLPYSFEEGNLLRGQSPTLEVRTEVSSLTQGEVPV